MPESINSLRWGSSSSHLPWPESFDSWAIKLLYRNNGGAWILAHTIYTLLGSIISPPRQHFWEDEDFTLSIWWEMDLFPGGYDIWMVHVKQRLEKKTCGNVAKQIQHQAEDHIGKKKLHGTLQGSHSSLTQKNVLLNNKLRQAGHLHKAKKLRFPTARAVSCQIHQVSLRTSNNIWATATKHWIQVGH